MLNFKFELNEMQERAKSTSAKNIIFSAPTGSGKTEAILLAAERATGNKGVVSYLLPTITSCIFMYKRLCKDFPELNVFIRTSVLSEERIAGSGMSIEIMCPDAPLIDYVDLTYMQQPNPAGRLPVPTAGLNLILDEIDNYPPMVKTVLVDYIKKCRRINSIIIASATLDMGLRDELESAADFELIEYRVNLPLIKYKYVDVWGIREAWSLIRESHHGKKVGVIMNSITGINKMVELLEEGGVNTDSYLIHHAQLNEAERLENEERLFNGDFSVCISNDVISFSVDVDFDILIMELSDKMSVNLQRLGRCNRYNKRVEDINVGIIAPRGSLYTPTPFVYDGEVLHIYYNILDLASKHRLHLAKYSWLNQLREELPYEDLPEMENVVDYFRQLDSEELAYKLRPVPTTIVVPDTYTKYVYDKETHNMVPRHIATTRKVKCYNGIPWSFYPFESEDAEERTLVYVRGNVYRIDRRNDNGDYICVSYYGDRYDENGYAYPTDDGWDDEWDDDEEDEEWED